METWKLVALYLTWLLASGAIAVIFGVLAGEILWLLGIVELDEVAYLVVVDLVAAVSFVLLALMPWLLRHRLMRDEEAG